MINLLPLIFSRIDLMSSSEVYSLSDKKDLKNPSSRLKPQMFTVNITVNKLKL